MAGNNGSTEPIAGGATEKTGHHEEERVLRQAQSSPTMNQRHLYVVYSADAPQGPSAMQKPPTTQRSDKAKGMLDRSVQGQIGRMLRDVFVDVAEEPVPERFVKLLEALEAKEKTR